MPAGFASVLAFWMGGIGGRYSPGPTDTTPPVATLVSHPDVTGTASTYDFTVRFTDNVAISISSVKTGNVYVEWAGGFVGVPALISVDNATDGTPRVATFRLTPPGGAWSSSQNGTYHIWTDDPPFAAFDTAGNRVPTGELGTFIVSISSGSTPVDHNGGPGVLIDGILSSPDCLRYIGHYQGEGVGGLNVFAYLRSEYDGNPPIRNAKGATRTGGDGRWVAPLFLIPGDYYIVADVDGDGYEAELTPITVI